MLDRDYRKAGGSLFRNYPRSVEVEIVVNTIGWLHSVLAMSAIVSGAAMLLRQKGTRSHRRIGWLYVTSMVGLNVTALGIYRLSGHFGPFHAAAIVSLATVIAWPIHARSTSELHFPSSAVLAQRAACGFDATAPVSSV